MKIRRITAVILAMTFCMSAAPQVSAIAVNAEGLEAKNNGKEIELCSKVSFEGNTYVKSQEYDNIYEDGGQYVMAVNAVEDPTELVVIPLEREDISFDDNDAVKRFLNRDDLPKEAISSFNNKYQAYLESEDEDMVQPSLTLFEPAQTAATRASGDPDSISHYTYNGWKMMTYQFNYTNLSTGWKTINKGTTTKDKAALLYNVALSIGSAVNKRLSYFSSGTSILNAFLNYYGLTSNDVTKNVSDYFQARLVWDQSEKYTMRDFGGMTSWQTGLVTYKVTVRKLGQETYFAKSGKDPYTTDVTYNAMVKSAHYDSPWATAYANGSNTQWENIYWSSGDVQFNFN